MWNHPVNVPGRKKEQSASGFAPVNTGWIKEGAQRPAFNIDQEMPRCVGQQGKALQGFDKSRNTDISQTCHTNVGGVKQVSKPRLNINPCERILINLKNSFPKVVSLH